MSRKKVALVTGSSSGLGAVIAGNLESLNFNVLRWDLEMGFDVRNPDNGAIPEELDVLVNCAGVNRLNWLEDVPDAEWDLVMDTNAKGIFRMAQACAPALRKAKGTILNIVSNAAHMPLRCSAAYNASKGAALILTKQLARELAPDITVFSISPNKLQGTGMSSAIEGEVQRTRGWTPEQSQKYQLTSLLTGEETPVKLVGEFTTWLLSTKERHKFLTGCDIPYGA